MDFNRARIMPVIWHSFIVFLSFTLAQFAVLPPAMAQTRGYAGPGERRVPEPNRNRPKIESLNCERLLQNDPRPWVHAYCEAVDYSMQDGISKYLGYPRPSRRVVEVPAIGTAEAKAAGVFCSEGRVIRRVGNGWEQALDRERNYLRCRPSVELPSISIGH